MITQAITEAYNSGLLLDEVIHGLLGITFSLIFWLKTKNLRLSIVPFITVYAIDLDHLLDYWLYHGFGFNLVDFLRGEYFDVTGRAIVIFHAYEWILMLIYITWKKGWNTLESALIFGMSAHLIWDVYTVQSVVHYSLLFRALNGFVI